MCLLPKKHMAPVMQPTSIQGLKTLQSVNLPSSTGYDVCSNFFGSKISKSKFSGSKFSEQSFYIFPITYIRYYQALSSCFVLSFVKKHFDKPQSVKVLTIFCFVENPLRNATCTHYLSHLSGRRATWLCTHARSSTI